MTKYSKCKKEGYKCTMYIIYGTRKVKKYYHKIFFEYVSTFLVLF